MSDYKECPYCAEKISIKAIKCKHCKSMLNEESPGNPPLNESSSQQQSNEQAPSKTVKNAEPGSPEASGPSTPQEPVPPPATSSATLPPVPESPSPSKVSPSPAGGPPPPPVPLTASASTPPPPPAASSSPAGGPPPPPVPPSAGASTPFATMTAAAGSPPPGPGATAYQHAPGGRQGSSFSIKNFIEILVNLFRGGDFSASRLGQVETTSSLIIIAIAAVLGPLVFLLSTMSNMSGMSGIFGRLFVNIFLAGAINNLLIYAVIFGLLFGWFEIKKIKVPISAHLALTAVVSLVLFLMAILTMITMALPWMYMGYILITLVVFRYFIETYQSNKVYETLAVLALWLIIEIQIVNRIIQAIFSPGFF